MNNFSLRKSFDSKFLLVRNFLMEMSNKTPFEIAFIIKDHHRQMVQLPNIIAGLVKVEGIGSSYSRANSQIEKSTFFKPQRSTSFELSTELLFPFPNPMEPPVSRE